MDTSASDVVVITKPELPSLIEPFIFPVASLAKLKNVATQSFSSCCTLFICTQSTLLIFAICHLQRQTWSACIFKHTHTRTHTHTHTHTHTNFTKGGKKSAEKLNPSPLRASDPLCVCVCVCVCICVYVCITPLVAVCVEGRKLKSAIKVNN